MKPISFILYYGSNCLHGTRDHNVLSVLEQADICQQAKL